MLIVHKRDSHTAHHVLTAFTHPEAVSESRAHPLFHGTAPLKYWTYKSSLFLDGKTCDQTEMDKLEPKGCAGVNGVKATDFPTMKASALHRLVTIGAQLGVIIQKSKGEWGLWALWISKALAGRIVPSLLVRTKSRPIACNAIRCALNCRDLYAGDDV